MTDKSDKLSEVVQQLQIDAAKGFATTKQHLELLTKQIEKLDLEIEVLRNTLTHGDESVTTRIALIEDNMKRIDWFSKTAIGMSGSLIITLIGIGVKILAFG